MTYGVGPVVIPRTGRQPLLTYWPSDGSHFVSPIGVAGFNKKERSWGADICHLSSLSRLLKMFQFDPHILSQHASLA